MAKSTEPKDTAGDTVMVGQEKIDESKPLAVDSAAVAQAATEFPLTLDEFCARLSQADKRVELIAGFHAAERKADNLKDLEANFRKRFDAFMKREVK